MVFEMSKWREIYVGVQRIGKALKDSYPIWDKKNKVFIDPISPLPEAEQKRLMNIQRNLFKQNDEYLSLCGLKAFDPLWHYNAKDPKTWVSHESFAFSHLLKDNINRVMIFPAN